MWDEPVSFFESFFLRFLTSPLGRLFRRWIVERLAETRNPAAQHVDIADDARPGAFRNALVWDLGPALCAMLGHAPVFFPGGDQLAAFPDRVRDRLFDVHVLAVPHGPDAAKHMPMVQRTGRDRVDAVRGGHVAVIDIRREAKVPAAIAAAVDVRKLRREILMDNPLR